jgi:hypothetical protein
MLRRRQIFPELRGAYVERPDDRLDVAESDVPFAPFDPVQSGSIELARGNEAGDRNFSNPRRHRLDSPFRSAFGGPGGFCRAASLTTVTEVLCPF